MSSARYFLSDPPFTPGFVRVFDVASGATISIGMGLVLAEAEAQALASTSGTVTLVDASYQQSFGDPGEYFTSLAHGLLDVTFGLRRNAVVSCDNQTGVDMPAAEEVAAIYFSNVYGMHPAQFSYCLDRTRHQQGFLSDSDFQELREYHRSNFCNAGLDPALLQDHVSRAGHPSSPTSTAVSGGPFLEEKL